MKKFYFVQVCLMSWRLPITECANLSWGLGNFPLLFYWIYYISLWLTSLLPCPWSTQVTEFLHIPFIAFELFKIFSLISILSLNFEILSSTWSSLVDWTSTLFFVWLKGLFISRISVWFFFSEVFHIFVKLLFYILCCLLYFIYFSFYSVLCFSLVFVEDLSEFI
jgi:hypothetical protein